MAQSWPWGCQIAVEKEKIVIQRVFFCKYIIEFVGLYKLIGEPPRSSDDYYITLQKQKQWILLVVLTLTDTKFLDCHVHSSSSIFNNFLGLQFPKQI